MTAREGPDDPSVVAMEEYGPLKLDKRCTLEVGTGSSGLAAFGLSPPTPHKVYQLAMGGYPGG
jgi:hypothetical protein